MIDAFTYIAVYGAFVIFSAKRVMLYLHTLQQEDYDTGRLMNWVFRNNVIDKRLSLGLIVNGIIDIFAPLFVVNFINFVCIALAGYKEKDPRKDSKKKLAFTARAKRIFFTTYILLLAIASLGFIITSPWFWLICVQIIPFLLIIVCAFIQPIEDIISQMYWNEAYRKIDALKPTVIGITGSFGKTSVKHILGHILKTHAPTLVTPGSVNTPMGITRIIREELDENHKYLVVEMGAYGPGSIARLCRLTPPDVGIITAIGHAHYERFKSLDTVAKTKFELARAVLARTGTVVIHEQTLKFDAARTLKDEYGGSFIVCGDTPEMDAFGEPKDSLLTEDDLHIERITQTPEGIQVEMKWGDRTNLLRAPLYGIHHGHNLALAFAAARHLGIEVATILNALRTMPQIPHRLEVVKLPGGVTVIDDAYNSNPLGFHSAIDLLAMLKGSGRAILVTPGIVELGATHNEIHEDLGKYAAEMCDVIIAVNPKRIPTFIKGVKAGGKKAEEFATFQEAQKWLDANKKEGDVILLENDLPDLYERIPKI